MTANESEPEPIAQPPCESIAAGSAPAIWAWLTWGAGNGRFHVAARLVSLHPDGPSVTCAIAPPPGRQATIALETRDQREHGAEATVAAVRVLGRGVYLVRLTITESCEPAFWDAASACLEAVE
jgi:hypothetical protein